MNWIQLDGSREAEHISCDDLSEYTGDNKIAESICGIKSKFYIGFNVEKWVKENWEMKGCQKCIEIAKLIINL